MSKLEIKLKKSLIRRTKKQIGTVNALGLKKIGEIVEHSKTPEILGMINKVSFLLDVKEF